MKRTVHVTTSNRTLAAADHSMHRRPARAVYVDVLNPEHQAQVPAGLTVRRHEDWKGLVNFTTQVDVGSRGVALFLDLQHQFPDAQWYACSDDDTFWGEQRMG